MKNIQFSPDSLHTIKQHLENAFPNEGCGFLFGREDDAKREIIEAEIVTNSKAGDQQRRFEIHPLDYLKAERYAMESGLTFLGIYHSHPQYPAIPSIHDLKQAVPYFSYPIISVMDGEVDHIRSWHLTETGEFEEENIIELIEQH